MTEQRYAEYREFTEAIRKSGHLVAVNRLLPPDAATTVRVRNGKVATTDGPYTETKDQLGGYYVIEATDWNEAIQVASRIPGARSGCVEVRPIAEDPQTLRALEAATPQTRASPMCLLSISGRAVRLQIPTAKDGQPRNPA